MCAIKREGGTKCLILLVTYVGVVCVGVCGGGVGGEREICINTDESICVYLREIV